MGKQSEHGPAYRARKCVGRWLVRLGLWVLPPKDSLAVAEGDHLTRLAAVYGVHRDSDESLRRQCLGVICDVDSLNREGWFR